MNYLKSLYSFYTFFSPAVGTTYLVQVQLMEIEVKAIENFFVPLLDQ